MNDDFFKVAADHKATEKWRAATTAEYADYIVKRIESGLKITSYYDNNMKPSTIAIATAQIPDGKFRAAGGLVIIIPENFTPLDKPEGRTTFLLMQNGKYISNYATYIPLYKDTVAELKKRGYSSRYLKKAFDGTKQRRKGLGKELEQAFSAAPSASAPKTSLKAKLMRKIPGLH